MKCNNSAEIIHGCCLDVMGGMKDESVDAIVTDPPYGLNFMGKGWDRGVPGVAYWREALRLLRPGGHLVGFGGARTYHRLACSIEDAGFEIRDQIMWIYGSGFPKSMDVSKQMDRMARRDYVAAAVSAGVKIPGNSYHDWTKGNHSPSDAWWQKFVEALGADQVSAIERKVLEIYPRSAGWFASKGSCSVTRPQSNLAQEWEGWGTALKPAHEPIVLARKPIDESVAICVMRHGTGAINVDGCRIKTEKKENSTRAGEQSEHSTYAESGATNFSLKPGPRGGSQHGRWPANVCVGEDAAREIDEQSGVLKSGASPAMRKSSKFQNTFGEFSGKGRPDYIREKSQGGASRFFYCAKASRKERNAGMEGCAEMPLNWSSGDQSPGTFQSDGTHKFAQNYHPTVKPIALMRWLCRLVAPPGALILDPFCGSGSTILAAMDEGLNSIGIEKDAGYAEIAKRRVVSASARLF